MSIVLGIETSCDETSAAVLRDPSGDIQIAYATNGLPTTFIIDRSGRIRRREVGAREWADSSVVTELRALLAD